MVSTNRWQRWPGNAGSMSGCLGLLRLEPVHAANFGAGSEGEGVHLLARDDVALWYGLVVAAGVAGAELDALGGAIEDNEPHEAQRPHEVWREERPLADELLVRVDDAEVVQEDGVVLREGREEDADVRHGVRREDLVFCNEDGDAAVGVGPDRVHRCAVGDLGLVLEHDGVPLAWADAGAKEADEDVVADDEIVVQLVDDEEGGGLLLSADLDGDDDLARGLALGAEPAHELDAAWALDDLHALGDERLERAARNARAVAAGVEVGVGVVLEPESYGEEDTVDGLGGRRLEGGAEGGRGE